ncbi:hypothetical protein BJI48_04495 [Helicobacter sp. 11S02596-1]|nr:hypothetical protein BJI48_04495 [Helicobacter sp. 11S02596-1]
MVTTDIKKAIESSGGDYHPDSISLPQELSSKIQSCGTLIVLKGLHKDLSRTFSSLRKRLARRFSIIGSEYNFSVKINDESISVQDRDYFNSLEFIWEFGKENTKYSDVITPATKKFSLDNLITIGEEKYFIKGWIGSVKESGKLQDGEDNLNKISIIVRGKLAQEDILEEFREGGLYTKFLIGEIEADFLDDDALSDISTSSRQKLREDDERYMKLKDLVHRALKTIQKDRAELKEAKGKEEALKIDPIKRWYNQLKNDSKRRAEKLFGKIS